MIALRASPFFSQVAVMATVTRTHHALMDPNFVFGCKMHRKIFLEVSTNLNCEERYQSAAAEIIHRYPLFLQGSSLFVDLLQLLWGIWLFYRKTTWGDVFHIIFAHWRIFFHFENIIF